MKAAPCSWRVGTKVICDERSRASLTSSVSSPGMPKTYSTPSFSRQATNWSAAMGGGVAAATPAAPAGRERSWPVVVPRAVLARAVRRPSAAVRRTWRAARGEAACPGGQRRGRRAAAARAPWPRVGGVGVEPEVVGPGHGREDGAPPGRPWRRCRCTARAAARRPRGRAARRPRRGGGAAASSRPRRRRPRRGAGPRARRSAPSCRRAGRRWPPGRRRRARRAAPRIAASSRARAGSRAAPSSGR